MNRRFDVPVVLIIFNRPDTTERVFEQIKNIQPSRLFVIADGPRKDNPDDKEKCRRTRKVIDGVDWDCDITKIYSETNLGSELRVATGLTEVFSDVDKAIIIEDDGLPDASFFRFCEEMLEKYQDDKRIMQITGNNMANTWKSDYQSYHFSYYGSCWGWATWKRAWDLYDYDMKHWHEPEVREGVKGLLGSAKHYNFRNSLYKKLIKGEISSWDYRWSYTQLINSGLCVVPAVNLIENIGTGKNPTHSFLKNKKMSKWGVYKLCFPLRSPSHVMADKQYDEICYKVCNPFMDRIKRYFPSNNKSA